jgi:hypothetical protein
MGIQLVFYGCTLLAILTLMRVVNGTRPSVEPARARPAER